jgi:predicted O-linked N-acetylglucosamine transferase (SPINDLY family)
MPDLNTALAIWKGGNPEKALAEALAAHANGAPPLELDLLNLIAELYQTLKNPAAAADYLRRATAIVPNDAAAYRRLANAEFAAGSSAASIASYRRSLELEPRNVRAHNNLGQVLERSGDRTGAAACYRAALALDETYAIAHHNLGNLLAASGQTHDALERYRRAVALRPEFVEAWHNCAKIWMSMKYAAEALSSIDRALSLRPAFAEGWYLRAEVLAQLERSEEAQTSCRRAISLRPDFHEAVYALANLRRGAGDCRGAVAGFREALRINPDYAAARIAAALAEIPALPWSAAEIDLSRAAVRAALAELDGELEIHACEDAPALVGAVQPFYLAYQDRDNRELLEQHGRLCSNSMVKWQLREGLDSAGSPRKARVKIRIAVVSAQILRHSVYMAITRGWLERLDRSRFAIDVYHLGGQTDAETESARTIAEHFEQGPRTTRQWAQTIIEQRPDVVLYPEVGMDQVTLQLAAMRLARTQAAAWGHPVTSGLPTVDYYLSAEAFEPPDGNLHYSERLVRLPRLGVYYEPPAETPSDPPLEAAATDRGDAGGPMLVCAGTPFKYAPEHDAVLVEIARRLGLCRFHFFTYRDGSLSRRLLARLHQAFSAAGLDGADYLVLQPWASASEFHRILRSADVFLDTIGFSGFNTVMQALECHLPVVTCRGRFMRGRLGSGIMERVTLSRLVAEDPARYVDLVVSLAEDSTARSRLREELREKLPLAYRDPSAIEGLERFLLSVA